MGGMSSIFFAGICGHFFKLCKVDCVGVRLSIPFFLSLLLALVKFIITRRSFTLYTAQLLHQQSSFQL